MKIAFSTLTAGCLLVALAGLTSAHAAVDDKAAIALVKSNECTLCHSVDKNKKGPSYQKVAEKYKDKPDGEEKCIKQITTWHKVKLEDGREVDHKLIDTDNPAALKNLCGWILSRQK